MKLPTYMKTEFPAQDGKIIAKIYIKWWGWPIIYLQVLRQGVKANWLGWLMIIYILFKFWVRAVKEHQGIKVTVS